MDKYTIQNLQNQLRRAEETVDELDRQLNELSAREVKLSRQVKQEQEVGSCIQAPSRRSAFGFAGAPVHQRGKRETERRTSPDQYASLLLVFSLLDNAQRNTCRPSDVRP